MILNKIKGFFIKNKKEILLFSFFIIFIFSIWDNAFAVTENWWAKSTTTDWMSTLVEWINFLIKISSTIIGLLSALIALLLNPGWINGTIFGLDVYLKDIWILISNIVYFAFAFILIIISFMNIVWQWGGTWELKSALPKFVIWVIMVPFTWFFVQFVLSVSAFLTVAVLSLPYDVMENKDAYLEIEKNKICTNLTFDLRTNSSTDTTKQVEECTEKKDGQGKDWEYLWDLLSWNVKSTWASSSIFSIINVYTYWVMKIQDLTSVTKSQLEDIKTLTDLWLKLIFDIIFIIVFLIIMVALFMALFARWTWLWIYAMFSPIFGLLFFFWKSKDWVAKISPLEFIKLALVPVYVSAALAFGMIFMFVAAHWLTTKQENGESFIEDVSTWDEKASRLKIWVFSITLKWIKWWEVKKWKDWTSFNTLWNWIGQLLLEIFWLVILWIAVMAALKSSEITHNVVKPIISFGESIWSLVAKAPQYAPIIPTPGGGMSTRWLQSAGSTIVWDIDSKFSRQWTDFAHTYFWEGSDFNKFYSRNSPKYDSMKNEPAKQKNEVVKLINNVPSWWFNNSTDFSKFTEWLIKLWANKEKVKEITMSDTKNTQTLAQKLEVSFNWTHLDNDSRLKEIRWIKEEISSTTSTTPTSWGTTASIAPVNFNISNYAMNKDKGILEFDNKTVWWKNLVFNKSKITKTDWSLDDAAIKKIIKDNNFTDTGDKLLEIVKKNI